MSQTTVESTHDLRATLAASINNLDVYGKCGYVYGYPHKKAYRPLPAALRLPKVWAHEDRRRLYCYVHVPFCHMRCSFCNLFTYVPGDDSPAGAYLDALAREMAASADALQPFHFARLYIGGGTPTFLTSAQLRGLVRSLRQHFGVEPASTHGCIEASPETLDAEKVDTLRELGFVRVSLGVQSWVEAELHQVNRRFDFACHANAIRLLGRAGFPHFNIDLIYGLPGQTLASWRYSLEQAIDSPATSLFLYPLYVRPLTGLAVKRRSLDEPVGPTPRQMAAMYDLAVDRLTGAGFRQRTMRQFCRNRCLDTPDEEYRCQSDGMLGLGAGARSYTAQLHYSTPWRMVARNIRGVVEDYVARMRGSDTRVSFGFQLDEEEQQRRFVILSLLFDGLDTAAFRARFDADVRHTFAGQWEALAAEGLTEEDRGVLRLTARGVRHADIVGGLFFSDRVRRLMETYEYDS